MHALVLSRDKIPPQTRKPCSVLLLDASASMALGEPRRIDLLWRGVRAIKTPQSAWKTALFNNWLRWTSLETIPRPEGTTDLAQAFGQVAVLRPTLVTLVTDGEPDDADAAMTAGVALACPINILYVGERELSSALEFCKTLCRRTGGTFATDALTLQSVGQLSQTIQKMLVADTTRPSAIVLGGA